MDAGVMVKWVHIVSSTVLFGTGLGTAYYFMRAVMTKDPRIIAPVGRMVVQADWMFTLTSGIVQAITGVHLVIHLGYDFGQFWIRTAIALYVVALLCWLLAVWAQIKLTRMARESAISGAALPAEFWRLFRIWIASGWPAFLALLAVFYLMVAKPV